MVYKCSQFRRARVVANVVEVGVDCRDFLDRAESGFDYYVYLAVDGEVAERQLYARTPLVGAFECGVAEAE